MGWVGEKRRLSKLPRTRRVGDNRRMERCVRITTGQQLRREGNADLRYWLSRPVEERLAALEQLRQQYIREHFDAEPGLQRVYRVTQRQRR